MLGPTTSTCLLLLCNILVGARGRGVSSVNVVGGAELVLVLYVSYYVLCTAPLTLTHPYLPKFR
jgi:hypothetical protein